MEDFRVMYETFWEDPENTKYLQSAFQSGMFDFYHVGWLPALVVEVIETVPSLCVSLCEHSHGWTVWHIVMKSSTGIDLDGILDKFNG